MIPEINREYFSFPDCPPLFGIGDRVIYSFYGDEEQEGFVIGVNADDRVEEDISGKAGYDWTGFVKFEGWSYTLLSDDGCDDRHAYQDQLALVRPEKVLLPVPKFKIGDVVADLREKESSSHGMVLIISGLLWESDIDEAVDYSEPIQLYPFSGDKKGTEQWYYTTEIFAHDGVVIDSNVAVPENKLISLKVTKLAKHQWYEAPSQIDISNDGTQTYPVAPEVVKLLFSMHS